MATVQPTLETVTTIRDDGSRRFIHPADVRGRFTAMRSLAGLVLMAVYVALPWIPVNGNPAVFLDVSNRQVHLFGLTLAPQDYWLAFFLVTGAGFILFYLTALLGRVWCGWACPQTVFLDLIRRVERLIEGDSVARQGLDASPWTTGKVIRRGLKNLVFTLFALALAHVFLSYFVSLRGLYSMVLQSPLEHWSAFIFVFLMTGALWFDFAWFREQFCIVMCPYGRLQSALIDDDSIVIGYDRKRGEPRGKLNTPGAGDCIDCRRCVQVCPTGIDIRQGLQLECIACSSCIDACDEVMDKLNRPRGLVRYDSTKGLAGLKRRFIRPRMLLYTALLLLGAVVMTVSVCSFRPATVSVVRMTGEPFYVEDGNVRNQFLIRIINKQNHVEIFKIRLLDAPEGWICGGSEDQVPVSALSEQIRPLIIVAPRAAYHGSQSVRIAVSAENGKFIIEKPIPFLGP
jgi:cytochrome c oxidase accessory protein FixG